MATDSLRSTAERYAHQYITRLHLSSKTEPRCEWSCVLWSKDNAAAQAQKSVIELQQIKEKAGSHRETFENMLEDSRFLNTVAQVYSKLFSVPEESCRIKNFTQCPYMNKRDSFLEYGLLANTFVTILQKATLYSMLERHPLDSGLVHEEYTDVYGVNLTDFDDVENSLRDGRFEVLFKEVVKRASQLAGLPTKAPD